MNRINEYLETFIVNELWWATSHHPAEKTKKFKRERRANAVINMIGWVCMSYFMYVIFCLTFPSILIVLLLLLLGALGLCFALVYFFAIFGMPAAN